ncbi:MAG: ZIP family metal transporter [Candidatus Pacearchaeota archaeon]|nr:ZIP family metal transporter [Candidatus Pacearchaeota archaeon]
MLISILLATFIVSLISFIGILTLAVKPKTLNKILLSLVAMSAGALIGTAFLHLLPESLGIKNPFLFVLLGFILFFLIERFLHWQHCHEENCKVHTFAYMNLIGGAIHNFIDGLIIASSFLVSSALGIITTVAIAIHEIPQEIGNFGVLVYGGFKIKKALLINFLVTLTKVLGGLVGFFVFRTYDIPLSYITAIAAGGFIYIAASDLIPELREKSQNSISHLLIFLLGIVLMWLIKLAGFS